MTATKHRVWMTPQDYVRLLHEFVALRSRRSIDVPTRVAEIEDLLANAGVDRDAVGGGIAKPGMVLTIRYDATGETETFLLGRRGAPEDAEIKVYSMASPLGRAIAGARPGEQRIYSIPDGTHLVVTLLTAVPYGRHVAKSLPHYERNGL